MSEHSGEPWYATPSGGHELHGQWMVVSEKTAKTIAIVYTGKDDAERIAECVSKFEGCEDLDHFEVIDSLDLRELKKEKEKYREAFLESAGDLCAAIFLMERLLELEAPPEKDALCHVGITTMEECSRCAPLLRAKLFLDAMHKPKEPMQLVAAKKF